MSDNESEQGSSSEQAVDSGSESQQIPLNAPKQQKPLIVERQDNDVTCATYVFNNEDHTLGNALRTVLARSADIEFVGYSIPHPSETKMNMRVQTTGANTDNVLQEGLRNIEIMCKIMKKKFLQALH